MAPVADVISRDVHVKMFLPKIVDVRARYPAPRGFRIRRFRTGEEAIYHHIWEKAERHQWNDPSRTLPDDWFTSAFGINNALHEKRIHFVEASDGTVAGATTAWFADDAKHGPAHKLGKVHYVCMLPAFTGMGLAKPLLAEVLACLCALGHVCCDLGTSTGRVAAINLYAKFGFLPLVQGAADYRAWRELQPLLQDRIIGAFSRAWPRVCLAPRL